MDVGEAVASSDAGAGALAQPHRAARRSALGRSRIDVSRPGVVRGK
jgi:hypothetical protein